MVVILQHQHDAPAGLITRALDETGVSWRAVRLDRDEPLPDPDSPALAISLGSDASAADTDRPWIGRELDWLRAADEAGTAIFGICFGGQALATAFGGAVIRGASPERGWVEFESAEPDVVAGGPWLTWHDDAIVLPPDAHLVAANAAGPQAFRLRNHLGVQFHPEVTPAIVADWVRSTGESPAAGILDGGAAEYRAAAPNAHALFTHVIDAALGRSLSRSRSR